MLSVSSGRDGVFARNGRLCKMCNGGAWRAQPEAPRDTVQGARGMQGARGAVDVGSGPA